jgi:Rrf2 family protein
MKLSCASTYAISALSSMASQDEPGAIVASHHTARAQGIPDKMLLKVLGSLARAGLVQSLKGPKGGYRLARTAGRITLLEIVEAVDGPIRGDVPALVGPSANSETDGEAKHLVNAKAAARLQEIFQQIAEASRKQLGKVRLLDLIGGSAAPEKAKTGKRQAQD